MSKSNQNKINFVPYSNESDVISIDGLSIENRTDRIDINGGITITKDKSGLSNIKTLKKVIDNILLTLEQEPLPDSIKITQDKEVPNPLI